MTHERREIALQKGKRDSFSNIVYILFCGSKANFFSKSFFATPLPPYSSPKVAGSRRVFLLFYILYRQYQGSKVTVFPRVISLHLGRYGRLGRCAAINDLTKEIEPRGSTLQRQRLVIKRFIQGEKMAAPRSSRGHFFLLVFFHITQDYS